MGVLSTLYIVFALNKQNTSILSDYLVIFFNTTLWHHEIAKRAEEGARNHGLLNISAEDFLDINIIYPKDLLEQQKSHLISVILINKSLSKPSVLRS